jgi:hypothetical protein
MIEGMREKVSTARLQSQSNTLALIGCLPAVEACVASFLVGLNRPGPMEDLKAEAATASALLVGLGFIARRPFTFWASRL